MPGIKFDRKFTLLSIKPKDMMKMVHQGRIDYGVNYSNVVCPHISERMIVISSPPIPNLRVSLLKPKGKVIKM